MPTVRDYDVWRDIWPEGAPRPLAPVRVGVDRITGKVLIGWPHTEQSLGVLFVTGFHQRILRQWVGCFVPHILGKNAITSTFTRFFWAIATAIDLWEPNYRMRRIRALRRGDGRQLTSAEEARRGEFQFQHEGVHRPRGHLGDTMPEDVPASALLEPEGLL